MTVDLGEGEEAYDGEGTDLVVREYDASTFGTSEPIAVAVAQNPAGPFTELGTSVGSVELDLADVGLASVRYVRVTSTATLEEILEGPGSPE